MIDDLFRDRLGSNKFIEPRPRYRIVVSGYRPRRRACVVLNLKQVNKICASKKLKANKGGVNEMMDHKQNKRQDNKEGDSGVWVTHNNDYGHK